MCKAPLFPLPDAQDNGPNYALYLLILISFIFLFIPLVAHHLNRSKSPIPKPQSTQPLPDENTQTLQTILLLTTAFDDLLRERNMLRQSLPNAQILATALENRELDIDAETERAEEDERDGLDDGDFPWPLNNSGLLSGQFEPRLNPFPWRSWVEDAAEEKKKAMRRAGPPGMEWMVTLDPD